MKINKELISAFTSARNGIPKERSWILADALQQAVAESLKANAWLTWVMNNKEGPPPSMMEDWLTEADKLLRGEK